MIIESERFPIFCCCLGLMSLKFLALHRALILLEIVLRIKWVIYHGWLWYLLCCNNNWLLCWWIVHRRRGWPHRLLANLFLHLVILGSWDFFTPSSCLKSVYRFSLPWRLRLTIVARRCLQQCRRILLIFAWWPQWIFKLFLWCFFGGTLAN